MCERIREGVVGRGCVRTRVLIKCVRRERRCVRNEGGREGVLRMREGEKGGEGE